MGKRGKKYREAMAKVQKPLYALEEACRLVKEAAFAKFDESVDLAVYLGVDPRHSDQMVRGSVSLPHTTGKKVRILVFAKGEKVKEAQAAGADWVGMEEIIDKINNGWLEFDTAVATPDLMGTIGRLGKILGPRGLMPNPKMGTVTFDLAKAIREIRQGKVEYRVDKGGIVHGSVGRVSFDPEKLVENSNTLIEAIVHAKPASVKGQYVKSITVSSTMGPGIRVDVGRLGFA